MDFFSKDFLKFAYRFLSCLMFFLLILLSIFIIFANSNSVSAVDITYRGLNDSSFSQNDSVDILNSFNNVKGNSQYFVCTLKLGQNAKLIVFDNLTNFNIFTNLVGNSYLKSTSSITYRTYWLLGSGRTQYIGTFNQALNDGYFDYSNSLPYVFSNFGIFNSSSLTDYFWVPEDFVVPDDFVNPSLFPNSSINQTEQADFLSGNFTFFKVNPRQFKS